MEPGVLTFVSPALKLRGESSPAPAVPAVAPWHHGAGRRYVRSSRHLQVRVAARGTMPLGHAGTRMLAGISTAVVPFAAPTGWPCLPASNPGEKCDWAGLDSYAESRPPKSAWSLRTISRMIVDRSGE
jgi:hypothetical protein